MAAMRGGFRFNSRVAPPVHLGRILFAALLVVPLLLGTARANPMLLVDMRSGEILAAEDAGQPWHPASLTKLMTAYVAFAAIRQGRLSLDTPIRISQNAWNQAPSKSGLEVGSSITLRDGLYLLIVKSANDVAVAISEAVAGSEKAFVAEMNQIAAAMGLTATNFVNPHGLHNKAQVTSARDLAVLTLYIRRDYPEYLPLFATEAVMLGTAKMESQNGLLTSFLGTTGMKTGYVCASGLNIVATNERNGRSLLAVVLGASSARERNEMTAELFLKAEAGQVRGTGQSIVAYANASGVAPRDMRPLICGKDSKEYVAAREKAFPYGLKGQPSFLTDTVTGPVHVATDLGRIRTIPWPRPRPVYAPTTVAGGVSLR
ncbi:D-alanyl-D-alanine carboxypeptidase [Devosia enhydra]|uniref:D-alanyl-D-alanine carboxypeptidase n=1 Tax=Devosia enhydra TaxID=665118 RepID=A0A1K2I0L9_9HYPH|nr:D-alanyl-D-alanine carboxypeptidase family protein [Devosia enhydra]SFZ85747.1 D-alanyl-D-alanine carboxypeptidase [Devosia enhydra]